MAATTNKAAWSAMLSKLQSLGSVRNVVQGEPRSKMQNGTVALIPERGRIDETTLSTAREVHVVTLRRYENALQESPAAIENSLDEWRAAVAADVFGDFELGGTVAYALPDQFTWEYGYQTVEHTLYRILDLVISYRVDDRITLTA